MSEHLFRFCLEKIINKRQDSNLTQAVSQIKANEHLDVWFGLKKKTAEKTTILGI